MKGLRCLVVALAIVLLCFALPSVAQGFAIQDRSPGETQNAYGLWYSGNGSAACTGANCHDDVVASQTVSPGSPHTDMVTAVDTSPSALVPLAGSWPTFFGPAPFAPADVFFMLGSPRYGLRDYVGQEGGPGTSGLGAGDLPYYTVSYNQDTTSWASRYSVSLSYMKTCAPCHNVGVTRPGDTTYTLANGGEMGPNTPNSVVDLSIQCEVCHGSGKVTPSEHVTGVPAVVGGLQLFNSQVCGQCHVTGTATENDASGAPLGSPNGYTTDQTLSASFSVVTSVPTEEEFEAHLANPTSTPVPAFLPNGDDYSLRHDYYNEWLNNLGAEGNPDGGHANPINSIVAMYGSVYHNTTCLGCHSGLGFLSRIGATYPDGSKVQTTSPTIAQASGNNFGISCTVCHSGHVTYKTNPSPWESPVNSVRTWEQTRAAEPSVTIGQPVSCGDCHNWQFEVLGKSVQHETINGVSYVRPAANTNIGHPQREMFGAGNAGATGKSGMWGVPAMKAQMAFYGTEISCQDCHMPATAKEQNGAPYPVSADDGSARDTRMSHRFHIVLPGDAETWQLRPNGDSCSIDCHKPADGLLTRADFQAYIDETSATVVAAVDDVGGLLLEEAGDLHVKPGGYSGILSYTAFEQAEPSTQTLTPAEWFMLQKAAQNVDFVAQDGSNGLHQPEYALAGLTKAKFWAQSFRPALWAKQGSTFGGGGASFTGGLLGYDGKPIFGAMVSFEQSVNGGPWSTVSTMDASGGSFVATTAAPAVGTQFRFEFSPDAGISYYSGLLSEPAPQTTLVLHPTLAGSRWVSGEVTGTLSCDQPDALTFYFVTGPGATPPTPYAGPFTISAEGTSTLWYWSSGPGGTEAFHSQQVRVDNSGPTMSSNALTSYLETASINITGTDTFSGVDNVYYSLDGSPVVELGGVSASVVTTALGAHTLSFGADDNVSNRSATSTVSFTVRCTPKLTKSPSGSSYTVLLNKTWKYSVTLSRAAGAPIAGKKVYLQRSTNNRTWSTYATYYASAAGLATRTWKFTARGTTYWRWSVPADTTFNAVNGSSTKVVCK